MVLGPLVARYIAAQRDRLAQLGMPLPEVSKLRLRQHFSDEDLDRVRIVQADPLPIPNPPIYPLLRVLKLDAPEPRLTEAITFIDLIASREPMSLSLLFHEMVHVVQYRLLGLDRFAELYLRGFFEGGGYHGIPLERCAYSVERRFISDKEPFAVDDEVRKWISADLF
jgi:hypothetical protein